MQSTSDFKTDAEPFDPGSYRLSATPALPPAVGSPPRKRRKRWFIKGPVDGAWIQIAAVLGHRALRAGLALWYLAGLKKSRTIKPTGRTWAMLGLSSDSARRGLQALERAGLVRADRSPGRCPLATILDAPLDELNMRSDDDPGVAGKS